MADNEKTKLRLREMTDANSTTMIKARESWSMFSIMSEFVETTENLADVSPAITIFGSARLPSDHPAYAQCIELARRLSDAGFAILSGGGPGIMEAANRGAFSGRSLSIGLNIELPREQHTNRWQNMSLHFRHFFARKVAFAKYADAYVLFPGGFGTLDEMCEVLTLIQTNKTRQIPVILVGSDFWNGLLDWMKNVLIPYGTISQDDLNLIQVIDDTDKVLDAIFSFYEQRFFGPSDEERQKMLYL